MEISFEKIKNIKLFINKNNSEYYQTKQKNLLIKITFFLVLISFCKFYWEKDISITKFGSKKRLKIGIVGVAHGANVGNNMIK